MVHSQVVLLVVISTFCKRISFAAFLSANRKPRGMITIQRLLLMVMIFAIIINIFDQNPVAAKIGRKRDRLRQRVTRVRQALRKPREGPGTRQQLRLHRSVKRVHPEAMAPPKSLAHLFPPSQPDAEESRFL